MMEKTQAGDMREQGTENILGPKEKVGMAS
jgi:hypothetical protein